MTTNKKIIATSNRNKYKKDKVNTQINNPNIVNNINITINTNSSNQKWSICWYLWLFLAAIFG